MTAFNASMSGTSITTATRLGFCGSTNVRMLVTPSEAMAHDGVAPETLVILVEA